MTLRGWASNRPRNRPTAICAANTIVASGIIAKARSLGLAVPTDLSVVSLLDAPLAVMQVPAITAVQYPLEELGRLAVTRLIDAIEQGTKSPNVRLPPSGLISTPGSETYV